MDNQNVTAHLSSIGLLIDIIGVTCLFFLKTKEIKKLSDFNFLPLSVDEESGIDDKINRVIRDFNENIQEMKNENLIIAKKSLIFFIMILVGFFLQFLQPFFATTSEPVPCNTHNEYNTSIYDNNNGK